MLGFAANSWKLNGASTLVYSLAAVVLDSETCRGLFLRTLQSLRMASCLLWSSDLRMTFSHLFSASQGCGLSVSLSLECLVLYGLGVSVTDVLTRQTDLLSLPGVAVGLPGHLIYNSFHPKPLTLVSVFFL